MASDLKASLIQRSWAEAPAGRRPDSRAPAPGIQMQEVNTEQLHYCQKSNQQGYKSTRSSCRVLPAPSTGCTRQCSSASQTEPINTMFQLSSHLWLTINISEVHPQSQWAHAADYPWLAAFISLSLFILEKISFSLNFPEEHTQGIIKVLFLFLILDGTPYFVSTDYLYFYHFGQFQFSSALFILHQQQSPHGTSYRRVNILQWYRETPTTDNPL